MSEKTYDRDVIKALMVVIEMTRAELSDAAQRMVMDELSCYPKDMVLKALQKCLRELRPGQFYMGAILDRIDLGHPSVEVAWAMASKAADEGAPVLWTDVMAQAWGQVSGLVAEGDKIAARMAFKECYGGAVEDAQMQKRMPKWELSPGHDRKRTNEAIAMAVHQGHISLECAEVLALPTPQSDEAAVKAREDEGQKLLTHSPVETDQKGLPLTVAGMVKRIKDGRAENEARMSAERQAAADLAARIKAENAARVARYAAEKGMSL